MEKNANLAYRCQHQKHKASFLKTYLPEASNITSDISRQSFVFHQSILSTRYTTFSFRITVGTIVRRRLPDQASAVCCRQPEDEGVWHKSGQGNSTHSQTARSLHCPPCSPCSLCRTLFGRLAQRENLTVRIRRIWKKPMTHLALVAGAPTNLTTSYRAMMIGSERNVKIGYHQMLLFRPISPSVTVS